PPGWRSSARRSPGAIQPGDPGRWGRQSRLPRSRGAHAPVSLAAARPPLAGARQQSRPGPCGGGVVCRGIALADQPLGPALLLDTECVGGHGDSRKDRYMNQSVAIAIGALFLTSCLVRILPAFVSLRMAPESRRYVERVLPAAVFINFAVYIAYSELVREPLAAAVSLAVVAAVA